MATRISLTAPLLVGLLTAASALAQTRMSLAEANQRAPGSFAPLHLRREVTVSGVVSTNAIDFRDYTHLFIQNAAGAGLALEGPRGAFAEFQPGDELDVSGTLHHRAGLPVLKPGKVEKLRTVKPPLPQQIPLQGLLDPVNLGRLVVLEAHVVTSFENPGGDEVRVGGGPIGQLAIFLPREAYTKKGGLRDIRPGDKIRVTGVSAQYSLTEPFNRNFEIIVDRADRVTLLARGWIIRPDSVLYVTLFLVIAFVLWWLRERSMAAQRRILRSMTRLSEYVIAASSPQTLAQRLESSLPDIVGSLAVDLYLLNVGTGQLERVVTETNPAPSSIPVDLALSSFSSVVALCFRNSALLHVPDTRRSPLFAMADTQDIPRAATFIPLLAQRETLGVLCIQFRGGVRKIGADQLAAMQHLSNQIAASLRLQDQQSMREQLLRSERTAAAGQLISGVATDLRAPLQAILNRCASMLSRQPDSLAETELQEIAVEALRGSELVNHVLAFSGTERSEPSSINIHALVSDIIELRSREWKSKGIASGNEIPVLPISVLADQSQLEQVFLNLVVQAEQALATASVKRIAITSRLIGSKIQIGIDVSSASPQGPALRSNENGDSFGWKVSQAIVEAHRGDMRLIRTGNGFRTEVDLPVHTPNAPPVEKETPGDVHGSRVLTAIVADPDLVAHRHLLLLLSARGHRVIPVDSAEEAAEMVQRMRFDLLFASDRLSGLNWVALFHRVRRRVGSFVLLSDSYDQEGARIVQSSDGHALVKPVDERELDRVLAEVMATAVRH